jgi:formamidopyrimidine-DNA glycosylase
MPELPEVETVRRGLERLIVGRAITAVDVRSEKSWRVDPACRVDRDLLGQSVTTVGRRGKVLILGLGRAVPGDSDCCLVAHLKMTGQLVFQSEGQHWGAGHPNDSLVGELPDRSTRVIVSFTDGSRLFFNDQRKFGWLHLMPADKVASIDLIAGMGPEPLAGDPWPEFLRRVRRHQATSIKAALLNQSVVAGVGNIYADESCWAVSVHPATAVRDLSDGQLHDILDAVRSVMDLSLAHGGSTDRNYVDAEGKRGSYLSFAHVFRREGQACDRCGTTILKTRVAGRGTHYCPQCQPWPAGRPS